MQAQKESPQRPSKTSKLIIYRNGPEKQIGLTKSQIEHYEGSLIGCLIRRPTIADRLTITPAEFTTIAGEALEAIQRQLAATGELNVVSLIDDVLGNLDQSEAGPVLAKWFAWRDPGVWKFFEARLLNPEIQSHRLVIQRMEVA